MAINLVLPSNVKHREYPDNKTNCYVTMLREVLDLSDGQYECAIREVSIPFSFYAFQDNEMFIVFTENGVQVANLSLEGGYYTRPGEFKKQYDKLRPHKFKVCHYQPNSRKLIITLKQGQKIEFSYDLSQILHLPHIIENNTDLPEISVQSKRAINAWEARTNVYVYCDIVHDILVGGELCPLICSVPITNKQPGYVYHHVFTNPIYLPVKPSRISQIGIRIADDTGEGVKFDFGTVIVKIQIRKQRRSLL